MWQCKLDKICFWWFVLRICCKPYVWFANLLETCLLLPLLESMHALLKFAHMRDVFVCNLVAIIKVCQGDLYNMYLEQNSNFTAYIFWAFKSLLECKHENIHMKSILNLNFGFQHLAFELNG
jgi:hypothetical protein